MLFQNLLSGIKQTARGNSNDGANIEQWTIGYAWRQNQEAKLTIVGRVMSWSNQQLYNIRNCVIIFSIVLTRE